MPEFRIGITVIPDPIPEPEGDPIPEPVGDVIVVDAAGGQWVRQPDLWWQLRGSQRFRGWDGLVDERGPVKTYRLEETND